MEQFVVSSPPVWRAVFYCLLEKLLPEDKSNATCVWPLSRKTLLQSMASRGSICVAFAAVAVLSGRRCWTLATFVEVRH